MCRRLQFVNTSVISKISVQSFYLHASETSAQYHDK